MFNWNISKLAIIRVFGRMGSQITLIKADESKARANAVWDSNNKLDLAQSGAKITSNRKQLYIAPNINKVPEVGDYIQQGADQWTITEVEAYKPTTIVLAYRVVCQ